jgi:PknH-like extracellular domain
MSEKGEDLPQAVNRWVGIVGLVVAPTTLITSLFYYFGYVSVRKKMLYLGMDPDAVGYTTSDYVTTSIGVVFAITLGLLAVSAALLLAALYIRRLVNAGRRTQLIRWAAWALIGVGVLATVVGLIGVWGGLFGVDLPWITADQKRNVTPAALGGAALLLPGFWMLRTLDGPDSQRRRPSVERAFVGISVAVVVAALFWATNIFATKTGEIDGINTAADLWWRQNTVVLDTTDRLHVDEALFKEKPLESTGPADDTTFRYQCFRALAVHGDRWVLVPAKWTASGGVAMIVTANSSNHITVKRIADPAKTTGRAPNVWKYWPCPELVRTAKDTEVADLLLGVDEARDKLGDRGLVADEPYTHGPTGADSPMSFESCTAAADSLTQLPHGDTGFVMLHGRTMTDAGGSPQGRWLEQNLLEFQNALQAGQFVKKVGEAWRNCAHKHLNLNYPDHTEQRTFGDVSYSPDDGVVVVSSTVAGEPPRQCSHALGAKSNVVADVHVCGPAQPTEATAILDAIRNKFPLWAEDQR